VALKRKIDKDEFEKLPKDVQKEYTAEGDGYILDVEGFEDVGELRRAKDREAADAKKFKKELKEATDKLAALEGDEGKRAKDIAKLEKEWQEKTTAEAAKVAARDKTIAGMLVKAAAEGMAGKISKVPVLMAKAIAERLSVDHTGDEPKLVVHGKDGKPSDLTLEQLQKEFVANKDYADIIIGTKASGSGTPREPERKPGGAGSGSSDKPASLTSLSTSDLVAHIKAKRDASKEGS